MHHQLLVPAVLLASLGFSAAAQPARIAEGKPFPALAFPTLEEGQVRSIADFRGNKVLLINFASW